MNLRRLASLVSILALVGCSAEPAPEEEEDADQGALSALDGRPEDALDVALRIAPGAKGCEDERRLLAALEFTKARAVYWKQFRHWDGWNDMRTRIKSTRAIESAVGTYLNYWAVIDEFDGTLAGLDRLLRQDGRTLRLFAGQGVKPAKFDEVELSSQTLPADATKEGETAATSAEGTARRRATAFTKGVAVPLAYEIVDRSIVLRALDGQDGLVLGPLRLNDWKQIVGMATGERLDLPYWLTFDTASVPYQSVPLRCAAP